MISTLRISTLGISFFFPLLVFGAELNAGFVQGLWYADETLVASTPTRIYIALRNNTDHDLTGTVRFTDNGTRIGIAHVNALPGRIVEAWVDWTPLYGEHTVTATLSDVRVHTIGETPEVGEVSDTLAENTVFVDYDTDKDGLPNKTDTDDDDDSVSDADEIARGTNPNKVDAPASEPAVATSNASVLEGVQTKEQSTPTRTGSADGLERYVPNQAAQTVVQTITDTIHDTKTTLDAYREKRSDALNEYLNPEKDGTEIADADVLATITRSSITPKESFLESSIHAGRALVSGFYSLILWLVSSALAHPAILELILLLAIVIVIYRTARRLGRRRQNTS